MSKAISIAGVSAASLRTRVSAGCRRSWSASNDKLPPTGMTSSPSRMNRLGASAANADTTSGK
jgi:hypothetical protein